MSITRRKSDSGVSVSDIKDLYNPFPGCSQYNSYDLEAAKSPKISKRAWKCFQLVLLCQKLLKPFSSSNKVIQSNISKSKSNNSREVDHLIRQSTQTSIIQMRNTCVDVQTCIGPLPSLSVSASDDFDNGNQGSEDFPYNVDESVKQPYWDLDIDSAIVGDYNSMSAFSLDEHIDPHYTAIKMSDDGRFIEKCPCVSAVYENEKIALSNTSSPKSGIYSKIIKPSKIDYLFNSQINDYYRRQKDARLDFESIMAIRNQLGLCRDFGQSYPCDNYRVICGDQMSDTPDIPRRNYGSSVINYIAKLRQNDQYQSSNISSSIVNIEKDLSSSNVYSPIWMAERKKYDKFPRLYDTPMSEPISHKRSINKILHQLNEGYRDDSSEDKSSISFNTPLTVKYSYPRNFSDNYSRSASLASRKPTYVNILGDEIDRFRHIDSELDIQSERPTEQVAYRRHYDKTVPFDGLRSNDLCFMYDETMFLQPLMERSCEEDYFNRDILSSFDYINV